MVQHSKELILQLGNEPIYVHLQKGGAGLVMGAIREGYPWKGGGAMGGKYPWNGAGFGGEAAGWKNVGAGKEGRT